MTYTAVLFDLDGTLLDTLDDLADSMNAVLAERDLPVHPVDAYRYFVGDGMRNLAIRVLPERLQHDTALQAKIVDAMWESYAARRGAKTKPYEGITAMLDGLAERGVRMAVLSNKPDDLAKLVVAEVLGRWTIDPVLGAQPSVPLKPDPAAALAIAEAMGLPTSAFLYLGDTATDMRCAVGAGMYPVGALWGFRTADELTASGAKALAERPQDLLKLL